MSHAGYLRSFWTTDDAHFLALTRALYRAGLRASELVPADAVAATLAEIDAAGAVDAADRGILAFVVKLTLWSAGMKRGDVEALRQAGLSDHEVHDVVHVASCFSYMNRLADGTGVTLESTKDTLAIELFGDPALRDHLAWGDRAR